jgi:SH3-like domain-containing protein
MRFWGRLALVMLAIGVTALTIDDAQAQRKPPYFASISAGKARMRTGPGRQYPASWLYKREDLPIKVVDIYGEWRKIEDPDGTQGWMQVNLLSDARTAMVKGTILSMRDAPRFNARVTWRAAPGVVGRISRCSGGWCYFDVHGRGGYVEISHIWGADPNEVLN